MYYERDDSGHYEITKFFYKNNLEKSISSLETYDQVKQIDNNIINEILSEAIALEENFISTEIMLNIDDCCDNNSDNNSDNSHNVYLTKLNNILIEPLELGYNSYCDDFNGNGNCITLESLPNELHIIILQQCDLSSLYNLSKTCSYFRLILNDDYFWEKKFIIDYGMKDKPKELTWKQFHLKSSCAISFCTYFTLFYQLSHINKL